MEDIKEIWLFLRERKKWWLTPIVLTIILLALLVFAGSSTAVAPFVYTLF